MSAATQLREGATALADATPEVRHHASLAEALVIALAELTVIEKGQTPTIPMKAGGNYSYPYAVLADVVKRTRPVLARNGVVALTPLGSHDSGLACSVVLLHSSGDSLTFGPFPFPHGRDAQATGSMVTYMRRYALVAALGMPAGADDDGAAAQPRQAPTASQPHPLRAKAAELNDDGKVWQFFLSRAGITDDQADLVLEDSAEWRTWLAEGIAAHIAAEPAAEVES